MEPFYVDVDPQQYRWPIRVSQGSRVIWLSSDEAKLMLVQLAASIRDVETTKTKEVEHA